jgi:hypothetical protein
MDDGEIDYVLKSRVFTTAGDVVLVNDLTHSEAVQTYYAMRRYTNAEFMQPPYRFMYAEPYFAWHPVRLFTGKWSWLCDVMIIHVRKGYGDCTEYEVFYAPFGESDLLLTKKVAPCAGQPA